MVLAEWAEFSMKCDWQSSSRINLSDTHNNCAVLLPFLHEHKTCLPLSPTLLLQAPSPAWTPDGPPPAASGLSLLSAPGLDVSWKVNQRPPGLAAPHSCWQLVCDPVGLAHQLESLSFKGNMCSVCFGLLGDDGFLSVDWRGCRGGRTSRCALGKCRYSHALFSTVGLGFWFPFGNTALLSSYLMPLSESFHTHVRNIRSSDRAKLIFHCPQRNDMRPEVCLITA